MTPIRVAPEALSELIDAAAWYDSRRIGLGTEFLEEVERILPLIERLLSSFTRQYSTVRAERVSGDLSHLHNSQNSDLVVPR